ncbi:MAG: DVU_1556 family methyltransferase [Desulfovibrionaceae bacterium]
MHHAPLAQITGGPLRPGGLALTAHALDMLPLPASARVLDVGCGNGASLALLAARGHRALGVDIAARNLTAAATREEVFALAQADAGRLPLRHGALDAVLCECVLSLLPWPETALAEFHRVLRPGGSLALCDVYARTPAMSASPLPAVETPEPRCCLDGLRTRRDIMALLCAGGFTISLWEDHSRHLAQLAGQLIFSHGSLAAFWNTMLPPDGAARACAAGAASRPGYYLLLARKD